VYNFGENKPLVFDEIVSAAYRNRGELANIPGTGWTGCVEYDIEMEEFMNSVSPEKIVEFNELNFHLHNTSKIKPHFFDDYLDNLRTCKWYGPFKNPRFESIYFVSINSRGNAHGYLMWKFENTLNI
jgi:hypothetical protein